MDRDLLATDVTCVDAALVRRAARTVRALQQRGLSVVTAESCTAGLICTLLSQTEGAGEVLHGSFVVYSKEHKTRSLGVDASMLRRDGAVNAATAEQMLTGALARSSADVAMAVTGVLGPNPDEDGNPVGLVFLSVGRRGWQCRTVRRDYGKQPHDALRRQVVEDAMALLDDLA